MSTEQQRAEFEVWHEKTFGWSPRYFDEIGVYSATAQERWLSYQAGRAALQSQDREDAEEIAATLATVLHFIPKNEEPELFEDVQALCVHFADIYRRRIEGGGKC